jgi:DNA-cytosine methyltransferase
MLKMLSLFSGIGAFEKALARLKIPFELVHYCEFDKYAAKAYSLIHGISESFNLGDVRKVDETKLPDFDLMTYGFPCQSISIAGKQEGIIKGETRSGLYYEALRILQHKKPKYAIAENVAALTHQKFSGTLNSIIADLIDAGYRSYWKVLNAKDFGVPQNRERIFIVSIRKDIEQGFVFPIGGDTGIRLKDVLEQTVDEKYYLSETAISGLMKIVEKSDEKGNGYRSGVMTGNDTCNTLDSNYHKGYDGKRTMVSENEINIVGSLYPSGGEAGRVYDQDGISPNVKTPSGGNHMPKIMEPSIIDGTAYIQKKYAEFIDKNGYIPEMFNPFNCAEIIDTAPSCTAQGETITKSSTVLIKQATAQGYIEAHDGDGVNFAFPNSQTRRGGVQDGVAGTLETSCVQGVVEAFDGCLLAPNNFKHKAGDGTVTRERMETQIHPALQANPGVTQGTFYKEPSYRIRKLTPLECFRLMGFSDSDYQILHDNGISDSQIYKMAGNSIVVNVLEAIFHNLLIDKTPIGRTAKTQLTLEGL